MFDPIKKRRQLEKRGWSPKRIDAYMNHCRHFTINPEKAAKHDQRKQSRR